MTKTVVVGSGIFGLSVAEFLSRNNPRRVTVVTTEFPHAGSEAAPANLSLNGQQFAREEHFNFKLTGRKVYSDWIAGLLRELGHSEQHELCRLWKAGLGVVFFEDAEGAQKLLKRVLQDSSELARRGLNSTQVALKDPQCVAFEGEAWLNGQGFLQLLKRVLAYRGVEFIRGDIRLVLNGVSAENVIFCTGAWTRNLLLDLDVLLPERLARSERLSAGTTFFLRAKIAFENALNTFSYADGKFTISGDDALRYVASSTKRIDCVPDESGLDLLMAETNLAFRNLVRAPLQVQLSQQDSVSGVRVAYGHAELVIEEVKSRTTSQRIVVCAGAHKSGFLYAPTLGARVANVLD